MSSLHLHPPASALLHKSQSELSHETYSWFLFSLADKMWKTFRILTQELSSSPAPRSGAHIPQELNNGASVCTAAGSEKVTTRNSATWCVREGLLLHMLVSQKMRKRHRKGEIKSIPPLIWGSSADPQKSTKHNRHQCLLNLQCMNRYLQVGFGSDWIHIQSTF